MAFPEREKSKVKLKRQVILIAPAERNLCRNTFCPKINRSFRCGILERWLLDTAPNGADKMDGIFSTKILLLTEQLLSILIMPQSFP